jgi:hypothetical protein
MMDFQNDGFDFRQHFLECFAYMPLRHSGHTVSCPQRSPQCCFIAVTEPSPDNFVLHQIRSWNGVGPKPKEIGENRGYNGLCKTRIKLRITDLGASSSDYRNRHLPRHC